jgi:hypothetical protein
MIVFNGHPDNSGQAMEFAINIHLAVGIKSPSNIYAHFILNKLAAAR